MNTLEGLIYLQTTMVGVNTVVLLLIAHSTMRTVKDDAKRGWR